jgi:myo-inositol 2-dehydrogenase/D-chiro-inositol 1-dehydrogenase
LIESGELGEIHAFETMMSDVQDPAGKGLTSTYSSVTFTDPQFLNLGHFVAFVAHSGGIFFDMVIHHVSNPLCLHLP